MHDDRLAARGRQRRSRARERLHQFHVAADGVRPRRPDLADDEHLLAAVLLHSDGDLRVSEVAVVLELRLEVFLDGAQRQAAGLEPPDQRKGERAVGFDGKLPRQVRLVVGRDGQHVLRTDDVVGALRRS